MLVKYKNNVLVCAKDLMNDDIIFAPNFEEYAFDADVLWVETERNVVRGYNNSLVFEDDVNALPYFKQHKKNEIAAARYAAETGGCTVDGVTIATDRGSQALLTAAVVTARLDPEFRTRWKCADGHFVTLDAMQLCAIGDAVTAHIEACFSREGDLCELIDAAQTAEDLAAIQWSL